MKIELIKALLIIASAAGIISSAFVQKFKSISLIKCSSCLIYISFTISMIFGVVFTLSFTNYTIIDSLWVGLFSFIGADTIYRNLEGKLSSYTELTHNQVNHTSDTDTSNTSNSDDVIEEIKYE